MARSNEPVLWALFGAGGMVAALVGPVLVLLLGIAGTLDLFGARAMFAYAHFGQVTASALVRLALFPVIALPMWHWAHRFRYILVDLGMRRAPLAIAGVCYTVALAVTGCAAVVLWNL